MKYNKVQIKHLGKQKASFISQRHINPYDSQQIPSQTPKNIYFHHRGSEQRISQQKPDSEFLNIFEDEDLSDSGPFRKLDNCKSEEDFKISFANSQWKNKPTTHQFLNKQSLQSNQSLKFPMKSVSQRNLYLPGTPNPDQNGQYLVIKKNSTGQRHKEQNAEIKQLKQQIKKIQHMNRKIKEENIQLRIEKMKLTSNSEVMKVLSLKVELRNYTNTLNRIKEIKQDTQNDNTSIVNDRNRNRGTMREEYQGPIYLRTPTNSLKPSTTELDSPLKANTPKNAKTIEHQNKYSPGLNLNKIQSSCLIKKY